MSRRLQFVNIIKQIQRELGRVRLETDSPQLDVEQAETMINNCDLWLTPTYVEDFDANFDVGDWQDLNADERKELKQHVTEFKSLASRVPNDGPVRIEIATAARKTFSKIAEIVLVVKG